MCRLLQGVIECCPHEILGTLLDTLVKASRSDPLNHGKPHPHGWGYVLIGKGIYEYHSGLPIYRDADALSELKHRIAEVPSVFLVHVRRKSPGTPVGPHQSHPYHYMLENGIDMWLAFNGGINIGDTRYRSDAYFLGLIIHGKCGEEKGLEEVGDCIYRVYRGLSHRIVSGGNLAYLLYDGTTTLLGFVPVYTGSRKTYYSHYLLERGGVFLIASSSLIQIFRVKDAEKLIEWMHVRRKFDFSVH